MGEQPDAAEPTAHQQGVDDAPTEIGATPTTPGWAHEALATGSQPGGMSNETAARWGGEESIRARRSEHAAVIDNVTPGPDTSQNAGGPNDTLGNVLMDRDLRFERQDHAASVGRMRRLLPIASVLWLGFFVVDLVVATWVAPGPVLPFALLRMVGLVPIAGAFLAIKFVRHPSVRLLVTADLVMTSSLAALLTAMCLESGGLTSPYNSYIPLVLVGRAAVLPNRWQDGAWRLGVPALINPLVMGIAGLANPEMAAQWGTAALRGHYFFYIMLISGAWLLLVIGGHNVWALRRQVFTSRSIGRYRLNRRIGRGGMGEVWIAFHEQLKRNVALKILRPDASTSDATIARFEREVAATAELSHPNTVRIFDHGVTDDGLWYYAMELLHGVDLATLIRRVGPLPPARALHLVRQAARALAEAHAHGIIHRDVKPENIFITTLGGEPDFVKVLDFGIAKLDREDGARLTTTGYIAGTPAYLPPEVATGSSADARADVYGLGGTLYFALTATTPFGVDNARDVLKRHLTEPLEPPSKRRGDPVPPDLEAVVMTSMEKEPKERYRHAGAMVEALDGCADAQNWHPEVTLIDTTAPKEPEPPPRNPTRRYGVE